MSTISPAARGPFGSQRRHVWLVMGGSFAQPNGTRGWHTSSRSHEFKRSRAFYLQTLTPTRFLSSHDCLLPTMVGAVFLFFGPQKNRLDVITCAVCDDELPASAMGVIQSEVGGMDVWTRKCWTGLEPGQCYSASLRRGSTGLIG